MKPIMQNDTIRTAISAAALAAGAVFALPAAAADAGHEHHAPAAAVPAAAAGALVEGDIRKIDKGAGKVTIKHGPIPSLDMPPMTMAYPVKDKAMLEQLKPGDKIKFEAKNVGRAFVVTRIEKVK